MSRTLVSNNLKNFEEKMKHLKIRSKARAETIHFDAPREPISFFLFSIHLGESFYFWFWFILLHFDSLFIWIFIHFDLRFNLILLILIRFDFYLSWITIPPRILNSPANQNKGECCRFHFNLNWCRPLIWSNRKIFGALDFVFIVKNVQTISYGSKLTKYLIKLL